MSIAKAIAEVIRFKDIGDEFSLIWLTEQVSALRGKWTTDGSVSRYLRWWNEGRFDHLLPFRWEVVRAGRYRISWMQQKQGVFIGVERGNGIYLF